MDEPETEHEGISRDNAIAGLSSMAGAGAVVVYTVVVTIRLLRTAGGDNPFGTIFFLILGAVVVFFLTAMFVAGLAGLVIKVSRRLEPSRTREREAEAEEHSEGGAG